MPRVKGQKSVPPQDAEIMRTLINLVAEGGVNKMAAIIGIPPSSVSRVLVGKNSLKNYRDRIRSLFPDINEEFLMQGTGEPGDLTVKSTKIRYEAMLAQKDRQIDELLKQMETQRRIIERLMEMERKG